METINLKLLLLLAPICIAPAKIGFAQDNLTESQSIGSEPCRQTPIDPAELAQDSMREYIELYTQGIFAERLLINQVVCNWGEGKIHENKGLPKGIYKALHMNREKDETATHYGEFVTDNPSNLLSVFFITKPDSRIRAMIVTTPHDGNLYSYSKQFGTRIYEIGIGTYTAISGPENGYDTTSEVTTTSYRRAE